MKGRGKGNEWLLLKKKDAEAGPGWDVEAYAYSVATGRTQDEIGKDMPARNAPKSTSKKKVSTPKEVSDRAPKQVESHAVDPASLPGAVLASMPTSIVPMKSFLTDKPPKGDE